MTDQDLERMLALDAAPGPALAIDAARADAIVEAALVGAGFGPGPSGSGAGGGATAGASGAGRAGLATGTKLAIVGGVALAVIVTIVLLDRRGGSHDQVAAVIPPDAAIDAPMGSGAAPDASIDDEAFTIDERPARQQPKPHRSDKERPADKQPTVDDLLGEANAKRAEKEWRESDLLYGRVVDKAPKSLAAQTALVASGSLHLEHLRDPRGAAKRFRRALELAPSGAVAEDARWGLAEALRALHDDNREAAALDDFLAHHASSPLASRAKARRAELP